MMLPHRVLIKILQYVITRLDRLKSIDIILLNIKSFRLVSKSFKEQLVPRLEIGSEVLALDQKLEDKISSTLSTCIRLELSRYKVNLRFLGSTWPMEIESTTAPIKDKITAIRLSGSISLENRYNVDTIERMKIIVGSGTYLNGKVHRSLKLLLVYPKAANIDVTSDLPRLAPSLEELRLLLTFENSLVNYTFLSGMTHLHTIKLTTYSIGGDNFKLIISKVRNIAIYNSNPETYDLSLLHGNKVVESLSLGNGCHYADIDAIFRLLNNNDTLKTLELNYLNYRQNLLDVPILNGIFEEFRGNVVTGVRLNHQILGNWACESGIKVVFVETRQYEFNWDFVQSLIKQHRKIERISFIVEKIEHLSMINRYISASDKLNELVLQISFPYNLTTVQPFVEFAGSIISSRTLKTLHLKFIPIEVVEQILQSPNQPVEQISFYHKKKYENDKLFSILQLLAKNQRITHLGIYHANPPKKPPMVLSDAEILPTLCTLLKNSTNLRALRMPLLSDSGPIDPSLLKELEGSIESNATLEELSIFQNQLPPTPSPLQSLILLHSIRITDLRSHDPSKLASFK